MTIWEWDTLIDYSSTDCCLFDRVMNHSCPSDDGSPDIYDDLDIHTESWSAMEEVVGMGIAKTISVSNYTIEHVEITLANAKIKPAVNQIPTHLCKQQEEVTGFCKHHGIITTAFFPFGRSPMPVPGMPEEFRKKVNANKKELFTIKSIKGIAKKHGKTVPQILLKFHVARGFGTIPKAINAKQLNEFADIFDFELDTEDM